MRNEKRIPIIIDFFEKNPEVLNKFANYQVNHENCIALLKKDWGKHPDFRLSQFLIVHGVIPDGVIWNIEETDWLIENNYFQFEELHFWGVNYDENNLRLPNTEFRLLKDLKLDHIKAILELFNGRNLHLDTEYAKYFSKRIKQNI